MWVLTVKLSPDWNGLVKIKKKLLPTEHLRRNEKGQNLKWRKHTGAQWHSLARETQGSGTLRGRTGREWVSLTHQLRQPRQEESVGDMLAMRPQEQVNFGISSSTFQTLTGIQISGILLKYRLWFRRSGVGPERLHFTQAPRWCQSCWSIDHQDLKSCENMGLAQYAMRRNEAMCVKNFRFPGRNLLFN